MASTQDMNRDPLTDEPGAHPVGTGVGASGGAVAGATVGALGGPIGLAVGGAVGAVVGGLAGKAAAEAINPTAEEAYWRDNYTKAPYYKQGLGFDDYAPAYRLGIDDRVRNEDDWSLAEPRLASDWDRVRAGSALTWPEALPASRAAWERADATRSSARNTDDALEVLKDLAETCKDGEYGFRECAEQAQRADLKSLFQQRADDCRQAAQELYAVIRRMGDTPDEGGTTAGALHRGWVSVKATFSTYDDKAVLEEAERGEDAALARYRKALKAPLAPDVRQLVERQLQGVQRNHDQVKALRDQFRATT